MIKLLVVDDEPGMCDILKKMFSPKGYEVLTATSGQDALSIIKKDNPELVLLDINMQGLNGLEVLRRIKAVSPKTKVVMVSISDDPDTKEKARVLGADGFVKKPFTTSHLEDVVILKVSEMSKEKEPAKILIADDEEGIRDSLKKFLKERFECAVSEAANGKEALDLLRAGKFDLVFLDIKMPGISGMDVIKEKKKLDYKPCIWVITRFDSEEVARNVIKEGADDYIPKPLSLRLLDKRIRDFLAEIGKYKPKGSAGSER